MERLKELGDRAFKYAERNNLKLELDDPLGHGQDGTVWRSDKNSAVKALYHSANYHTERRCYMRLQEHGLDVIQGLNVPALLNWDDELFVIEMEIVEPPFLLDFGKAYIDEPSPYSPEQLAAWSSEWERLFRKQDLVKVRLVLAKLHGLGIEYVDPKPSNIRFHRNDEELDDDDYLDFEQGAE